MKAVLLCGGYAKRLWPLTEKTPKPLLKVGGRPIVQHILERIALIKDIDTVYISTNKKFETQFKTWLNIFTFSKKLELVVEETEREKEKMGSIGGLAWLIKKAGIQDDLLVIAGDNLFEFSLEDFVRYYKEKSTPIIAFYDMGNLEKVREKYGVAELDKNDQLIDFVEKPTKPKSALVSTGCYLFPKGMLKLIPAYLKDGGNPDAPGFFISWLCKKVRIYGFRFSGYWFDLGSFESLEAARRFLHKRRQDHTAHYH